MPIRWDALLVRHLAHELHARLAGGRLRAVRLAGGARDLVLLFRDVTLVWRLHPSRGFPLLFPARDPAEGDLPLAATLLGVEAMPDERVLSLRLATRRGAERRAELIVELLGNQWNALITLGPQRRIRHVLVRREKGPRPMSPGLLWRAPGPSTRQGVAGSSADVDWIAVLGTAGGEDFSKARARLVSGVAWTSPLNAEYLLGAEEAAPTPADVGARWEAMANPLAKSEPVVLGLERGMQPYPFPLPGVASQPVPSLVAAFEQCARGQDGTDAPAPLLPPALLGALEASVQRERRRLRRLRSELAGLADPEEATSLAHLLLARFHEVAAGSAEALVDGFDGVPVRIAMDPALSVQDNAAEYYDRAARSRRAADRLPGLIEEAEARAVVLGELLEDARRGEVDEARVRRELPHTGPRSHTRGVKPGASLPYHRFESSGGLEIRVGRGARHNDALTFHHSAPGDVWLHARDAAGAHVILRWKGPGAPPARDLAEAAGLAALNSRSRTSGSVPVDWTLRKYVRKPRGASPGAVVPERVRTLFVEPDPSLPASLAAGRGAQTPRAEG